MSRNKPIAELTQVIIATLLLVLGGVVGYKLRDPNSIGQLKQSFKLVNAQSPSEYKNVDFAEFWQVWKTLETDYYDPSMINQKKMVEGAIEGMTKALGDPYTMYLPPVDQQRSKEDLQGSFYGIGIELGYIDDTLAVISPLKGSPAAKAGLQAGDLIIHVKDEGKKLDEDTTDWTLYQAVNNLRGDLNSKVTLTIYQPKSGKDPFAVEVQRGEIVVPSVEMVMQESQGKRAAVVSLSRFGERTDSEIEAIISQILVERPNISGIVVDLRNNPGGFFDSAIDIAGEFIKDGVVVSQQGRDSKSDYKVNGSARLANIPVVVIVNRGSASASEILAGALRDRRQAKLVGERTFGKGTVQDARELPSGAGLHVTIARWLLPSGSWIHQEGLPVDVEVKDDPETESDEVVMKAIETLGK